MSDIGFNIWGVITGTLGMRIVEKFMKETTELFDRGYNEGLHTNDRDLRQFCISIWALKCRIEEMKNEVKQLSTWHARVRGCWNGVTKKILSLQADVETLYDELIDNSSRNRKRLAAAGYAQGLAKLLSAQNQERQMSIMSLAVPGGRSVSLKHLGVDKSYPKGRLPDATHSHTTPSVSTPQTELLQERLPQTPPSAISSRTSEASLDPRRECRAARRDILCQCARQLCGASVASPCTYEGFSPLPLTLPRGRHRIRFKELIQEMARMMDEDDTYCEDDED
ncbi:hypothetical protein BC628DRAFT_1364502 [Trametes gibbosa]|nr:hypothetical protein BC628DRAFT_1389545 [Trametes gibbosa]KAI0828177.1 hypothetical protein BC628DRAFT_1364502 [Trametes gibbosa]